MWPRPTSSESAAEPNWNGGVLDRTAADQAAELTGARGALGSGRLEVDRRGNREVHAVLVVGSGKSVTPWARMHLAIAVIWLTAAADGFAYPGPPPDMPQTFWAAWNDGDPGLIPERLIL
jgi:hypothetical protein